MRSLGLGIGCAVGAVVVLALLAGAEARGGIFEPARVGWGAFPVLERRVEMRTNEAGQAVQVTVVKSGHGMYTLPLAAGLVGLALGAVRRPVRGGE